jgi:8-oxo-dGTP pyrophosphatase MutT (NUDIX family)
VAAEELARIRAALAVPEPHRSALPEDAAAVLLPLLPREGGLAVLFTRRTDHLPSHPGQVSFPGGRIGPEDKTPADAALRETEEEVGIPQQHVEVLGHLADYTTYYGRLVCSYVGLVDARAPEPYLASPDEVAALLVVPIAQLLDPSAYEGRFAPGDPRREGVVRYWHLPQGTIWGITGELLARFLQRAYGWQPPAPPIAVRSVAEFRDLQRRGM